MNFDIINLVLLLLITFLEFLAFGWLILEMKKSHSERDNILKLEEKQIAMERRILKALDVHNGSTPDLIEFLDHISIEGDSAVNLEEIRVNQIPDNFKFKTLKELEDKIETGCSVIGCKNPEGKYIINPEKTIKLLPNSKLFVLGKVNQIEHLNSIFNIK